MQSLRARTTVDLAKSRTTETPGARHHFGSYPTTYPVQKSESADDIYRRLGIDENVFGVYLAAQQRSFAAYPQAPGPYGDVYVYVMERDGRRHYGGYRSIEHEVVRVVISADTMRPTRFTTRASQEHGDDFTATMTYSLGVSFVHVSCHPTAAEQVFGLAFDERGIWSLGVSIEVGAIDQLYRRYGSDALDLSLNTLSNLRHNIRGDANVRNLMLRLKNTAGMTGGSVLTPHGNKSTLDRLFLRYVELLQEDSMFLIAAFHTLITESKRTINSVKVSKYFNEYFAGVDTLAAFKAKLEAVYTAFTTDESEHTSYNGLEFEKLLPKLPGHAALLKQAVQAKSGKALSKMFADIDELQFDENRYPVLAGLVRDGMVPVSTFFRKEGEETYFKYNDNWDLLEEFLGKYRDVGIQLAKLASQRTTYEKSFMSYLYFILHELPEYLKKYTGKDWTCRPSIVDSASELEPERTKPGETTKKRSALTPIVDNEKCEVVVPYACLKVPGISTTYTYSLNYSVVKRGFSVDGNVCTNDIELALNGRDDYGLMFYTLTGSEVGRGYPTFLIIFERLEGGTRVHFHRTYPLRSKGGEKNPVNNWIRTCYNWMAGNVNLDRIEVQQGDLVFVQIDKLPEGERQEVDSYDSHCFERPVMFVPCTKKAAENILGYFWITAPTTLHHPEHRDRIIEPGAYELRQCRSWEANPKGIWTLRID